MMCDNFRAVLFAQRFALRSDAGFRMQAALRARVRHGGNPKQNDYAA